MNVAVPRLYFQHESDNPMNKHLLVLAVTGLALLSYAPPASAHEEDEANPQPVAQQYDPRYDARQQYDARDDGHQQFDHGGRGLSYDVDHLNRMLAHVQGELRRYGADRHIAGEYQHLRAEANQLNNQFRRGEQYYNRRRLRAEIQHIHSELHHIEQELHVPSNAWYQWR